MTSGIQAAIVELVLPEVLTEAVVIMLLLLGYNMFTLNAYIDINLYLSDMSPKNRPVSRPISSQARETRNPNRRSTNITTK